MLKDYLESLSETELALQISVIYSLTLSTLLLITIINTVTLLPIEAAMPINPVIEVVSNPSPPLTLIIQNPVTDNAQPQIDVYKSDGITLTQPQQEEIKQYVYTIFGTHGHSAYAIAFAESKYYDIKTNQTYIAPGQVRKNDYELSVGLFQINLKSRDVKVHYDRIPGVTIEEKITWLKNPFNNTLLAFWIFTTRQNFEAWSVYNDGSYLAYTNKL